MIPVLTAAEMRAADAAAIDGLGLPGMALMESAGAAVAREIETRYPAAQRVAILCGPGNNGGDGYVVARRLLARSPAVFALPGRTTKESDATRHRAIFERAGGRVVELADAAAWNKVRATVLEADVVVDALFGTGLRAAPSGLAATVIRDLGRRQRRPLVAIDVPSGLDSDASALPASALRASLTVTFAALKPALLFAPAAEAAGEVVVADIGLPALQASLFVTEAVDARAAWPKRARTSHKGVQGHVLVIAGSPGKSGAAILAGRSALRAGCGLVTVATAPAALPRVAQGRPELMASPLRVEGAGVRRALALAAAAKAVVLGPGLGNTPKTRAFVRRFVAACPVPLVIDADGLNALVAPGDFGKRLRARKPPTVLTPHPGEAARLLGTSTRAVQAERLASARRLAKATGATVVLKGHQTLVAEPQGRVAVNPTGNPGLAVAGAGDVLAGIVGALLARGLDGWTAATAAAYVHGHAADRIAARRGEEGILAGDVADELPAAIHELAARA